MNDPQFDAGNLPYDAPQFTPEPPPKQHGCFFYGCIIAIVIAVLGLIAVGVVSYMLYSFVNQQINLYTSPTPVPIPQVALDDEQRKTLDERWETFTTALKNGEPTEIVLTADEVNALLEKHSELKGKVYLTIKDDQVSGQISWPLDEFNLPLIPKGRYLNGNASLKVSLEDGMLDVRMTSLEVNGKSPPPDAMAQFANENLVKNVKFDQDTYQKMRQIETLEIKDGKVHIKARARKKGEADEDKAKAKEEPRPKDADKAETGDGDVKPKPKDADKADDAAKEPAKTDDAKDAPKSEPPAGKAAA